MTSFEKHFAINMHIAPFLSGPALLALCQTHRVFRSFSEAFIAKVREIMTIKKPNKRLYFAAANGDPLDCHSDRPMDSRRLCELVREWTRGRKINWNKMLTGATKNNNSTVVRELCKLARKWAREAGIGYQIDWNDMLCYAAENGHRELCKLARKWACEAVAPGNQPLDWIGMIEHAAFGGHRDLCILARKWASREWTNRATSLFYELDNVMLRSAAQGGHRELCELAREWGIADGQALNWNGMLRNAARGGHHELCELAREWGANCWQLMLIGAVDTADPKIACELCELAHEWYEESDTAREATKDPSSASPGSLFSRNWNAVLIDATRVGNRDLCILAQSYGVTKSGLNEMLLTAVGYRNCELCELAHKWALVQGGTIYPSSAEEWGLDYKKALHRAADNGHWDICKLIRSWLMH